MNAEDNKNTPFLEMSHLNSQTDSKSYEAEEIGM